MIMKTLSFISLLSIMLFLHSCSLNKNYDVKLQSNNIYVTMHCPSIGIAGINQVSYDGFTYDEVEKLLYNKIRDNDYNGDYTIWVTMQFKDEYGNYTDGPQIPVTTLNSKDVKRYSSYRYFRGKSMIYKAFPWNYNYR